MQDLFRHLRIHTSDKMEVKLCFKCKIALLQTELKNVYKCPMCKNTVEEEIVLPRDQTIMEEE